MAIRSGIGASGQRQMTNLRVPSLGIRGPAEGAYRYVGSRSLPVKPSTRGGGLRWIGFNEIEGSIEALDAGTKQAVVNMMREKSREISAYAKANAPWEDQPASIRRSRPYGPSHARGGLNASVRDRGKYVQLDLSHGSRTYMNSRTKGRVTYGGILETYTFSQKGFLGIIRQTLEKYSGEMMSEMTRLFSRHEVRQAVRQAQASGGRSRIAEGWLKR